MKATKQGHAAKFIALGVIATIAVLEVKADIQANSYRGEYSGPLIGNTQTSISFPQFDTSLGSLIYVGHIFRVGSAASFDVTNDKAKTGVLYGNWQWFGQYSDPYGNAWGLGFGEYVEQPDVLPGDSAHFDFAVFPPFPFISLKYDTGFQFADPTAFIGHGSVKFDVSGDGGFIAGSAIDYIAEPAPFDLQKLDLNFHIELFYIYDAPVPVPVPEAASLAGAGVLLSLLVGPFWRRRP